MKNTFKGSLNFIFVKIELVIKKNEVLWAVKNLAPKLAVSYFAQIHYNFFS